MANRPSDVPSQNQDNDAALLDWANLAMSEGLSFLQSQPGYSSIDDIIKAINGTTYEDKLRPQAISQLNLNHMGKVALDLASSLTDIKPFWEYKTNNEKFEQQAQMGNKLATAWWLNRLADLRFCDVIKYALAAGSGYAHLTYNSDTQDQDLLAEDPRDVIPIRPSDMISIQNCFGVAIRRERSTNYLKHMYPAMANRIRPDRDASYAAVNKQTTANKLVESLGLSSGFMQNLYASLGGKPAATMNTPVTDVFTIYVKDDSLNMTGSEQIMGEADRNWSYLVKPGEPLYPRGRTIVLTRSCKLRDGPNIYWHGMFPIPKLTLDPWPWLWLGKSPLRDLLQIQREVDMTARGIADKFQKFWRPDLIADKKNISQAAADRIDTRRAGLRLRVNPTAGTGVTMPEPNIQSITVGMEWIKALIDEMKDLSGTQELSSLVQLGQIPSSETVERMIESWSPAIRLRSRVMESFLRELAMIVLMNFFQFYTVKQRIAVLGPRKGTTFEDFDFDPDTLIPDMLSMGMMDGDGNPLPRYERARTFIRYFTYQIAPGSLLAASEVTDKLMYLQLTRMGIMDPATLMEKLAVGNLGLPPDFPDGIIPRLQWFMQQQIGLAPGPASGGGAGGGPGRPASGQAMPRMTVKESG